MPYCAKCARELPADTRIVRQTVCPHCTAYLHACIQCRFHDPAAHNHCVEPQAEYVPDREKSNFCDFFKIADVPRDLGTVSGSGSGAPMPGLPDRERRARDARTKLDALFKKPDGDSSG